MRTIIRNNYTPKAGDYHERIIIDNSRHKTWLFDCDGIWTDITKIYLAEEFGDSSDIGLSQKFITEQFKATDGKIDELENTLNEEVAGLNERIDGVEEDLALETENRAAADEDLRGYIDEVAEDLEELKNSPDVVDIVNTKADLDAYDTSKLGENDIVRVLADETQDGASTYYKWTGSTWEYIGKTGPYYTKVETDNLLDGKADKSDTYTKTEVDNLIPDITPLATKQEVNDGLATKQNTLTAGDNITIVNDVISAVGGEVITTLTQDDYNYDSDGDNVNDCVALWLLPQGFYSRENLNVAYRVSSQHDNDYYKIHNQGSMKFILVQDGSVSGNYKTFTLVHCEGGDSTGGVGGVEGDRSYFGQIYRIDVRNSAGETRNRYATELIDTARIYNRNDWANADDDHVLSARLGKRLNDTKQNTLTAGENITIENDVISATGGTKSVELTQAEYDALTPEQKMDGTVYYITDGQGGGGKTYTGQDGVIVDNTNDVIKADTNYLDILYAPFTAIEFVGDAGDPSGVYLTVGDGAGRFSLTEETTGVLFDNETGGRVTRLASISYVDDHTSNEINDTDWSALWQ